MRPRGWESQNAAHAVTLHGRVRRRTTTVIWAAAGLIPLAVAYPQLRRMSPLFHGIAFQQFGAPIAQWGVWAATVSLVVMVANTFLPIPGESVGVVNGAIFGFWGGFAVSWIGVMCSAVLAFGIGRALPRRTLTRGRVQELLAYADALVERGWQAALVIRFVPFLPFTVFNIALGRASVGWGTFLWTTALGVLPVTAALVAIGCGMTTGHSMLLWGTPTLAVFIVVGLALRPRKRLGIVPCRAAPTS